MPGELALPSLEIHNFRGLRGLKISRLGRANLIVGKNNVGKTSVLEALRIYASSPPSVGVLEVLEARGELDEVTGQNNRLSDHFLPIRTLFPGRRFFPDKDQTSITIGPIAPSDRTLTLKAGLQVRVRPGAARSNSTDGGNGSEFEGEGRLMLLMECGHNVTNIPIDDAAEFQRLSVLWRNSPRARTGSEATTVWVGSNPVDAETLRSHWSKIALSDLETELVECLRLIEPAIERVNLIAVSELRRELTPFVRLKGDSEPVYLGSLGEGVNRLFGLSLGLLNASEGVMLIDEIENGLHYTILPDVWRFLFRVASRLNVQIFATTHSSDCVEAFQTAASESEEEGVLIRLARKGDQIIVAEFDERLMEIAVEGQIEIR